MKPMSTGTASQSDEVTAECVPLAVKPSSHGALQQKVGASNSGGAPAGSLQKQGARIPLVRDAFLASGPSCNSNHLLRQGDQEQQERGPIAEGVASATDEPAEQARAPGEDDEDDDNDVDFNPFFQQSPPASEEEGGGNEAEKEEAAEVLGAAYGVGLQSSRGGESKAEQQGALGEINRAFLAVTPQKVDPRQDGQLQWPVLGDSGTVPSACGMQDYSVDAISRRTRAHLSLADMSLEQLEDFLQESDGEDFFGDIDDEEEYRKFVMSVTGIEPETITAPSTPGAPESQAATPGVPHEQEESDDDDFDFDLDLELAKLSSGSEKESSGSDSEGVRKKRKRKRKRKTKSGDRRLGWARTAKKPLAVQPVVLKGQSPRGATPLQAGGGHPFSQDQRPHFTAAQVGQLYHQLTEHIQLLVQVFSMASSALQPGLQKAAEQCSSLIQELSAARSSRLVCKRSAFTPVRFPAPYVGSQTEAGGVSGGQEKPWCLPVLGPIRTLFDVPPLTVMDDFLKAVEAIHAPSDQAPLDFRVPILPLPNLGLNQATSETNKAGVNPAAASVSKIKTVHQVALVPRAVAEAVQKHFLSTFNPNLFPSYITETSRAQFTKAEDRLLALGIEKHNSDWEAIQEDLLPAKTARQIHIRQKNLCSAAKPDNPVKQARQRKSAPLTVAEKEAVEFALRAYRMDWAKAAAFACPRADPALLPRLYKDACKAQYKSSPAYLARQQLSLTQQEADTLVLSQRAGLPLVRDYFLASHNRPETPPRVQAQLAPLPSTAFLGQQGVEPLVQWAQPPREGHQTSVPPQSPPPPQLQPAQDSNTTQLPSPESNPPVAHPQPTPPIQHSHFMSFQPTSAESAQDQQNATQPAALRNATKKRRVKRSYAGEPGLPPLGRPMQHKVVYVNGQRVHYMGSSNPALLQSAVQQQQALIQKALTTGTLRHYVPTTKDVLRAMHPPQITRPPGRPPKRAAVPPPVLLPHPPHPPQAKSPHVPRRPVVSNPAGLVTTRLVNPQTEHGRIATEQATPDSITRGGALGVPSRTAAPLSGPDEDTSHMSSFDNCEKIAQQRARVFALLGDGGAVPADVSRDQGRSLAGEVGRQEDPGLAVGEADMEKEELADSDDEGMARQQAELQAERGEGQNHDRRKVLLDAVSMEQEELLDSDAEGGQSPQDKETIDKQPPGNLKVSDHVQAYEIAGKDRTLSSQTVGFGGRTLRRPMLLDLNVAQVGTPEREVQFEVEEMEDSDDDVGQGQQ